MIFGPLTKIHVKEILDLLQREGKSCEVIEDESLIPKYEVRGFSQYSRTDNLNDMLFPKSLFVNINTEDLLIVKKLFLEYGYEIEPTINNFNFEEKDYICPKCEYFQQTEGNCKNHPDIQLVEWLNCERKKMRINEEFILNYF